MTKKLAGILGLGDYYSNIFPFPEFVWVVERKINQKKSPNLLIPAIFSEEEP
jgi:hypothetical protein